MRHHHLSDDDLVLGLDGELSARRQAATDAHLSACASCRTKRMQLNAGVKLASALYRFSSTDDAKQIAAARQNLRLKLARLASRRHRSLLDRLAPPFARTWRFAALGVATLAVVLLLRFDYERGVRPPSESIARVATDALPVASLTPGATWGLTVPELCSPAGHEQRRVPDAIRVEVLRAYRMERVPADEYELDYLITPELGGAPTVQNLWPQRYASRTWNAHVKDQLERLLPRLVCDGAISLQVAQQDIAVDWITAYKKYFHTDAPLRMHARLDRNRPTGFQDEDLVYPIWRSGKAPEVRLISFVDRR